jgi:hypothetical protein
MDQNKVSPEKEKIINFNKETLTFALKETYQQQLPYLIEQFIKTLQILEFQKVNKLHH